MNAEAGAAGKAVTPINKVGFFQTHVQVLADNYARLCELNDRLDRVMQAIVGPHPTGNGEKIPDLPEGASDLQKVQAITVRALRELSRLQDMVGRIEELH